MVVRTPLASLERSFPSFIAYVGARFSRSRDGLVSLMNQVEQAYQSGKSTPDQRLANIVEGLKHQSPGGMAHVSISIENLPILTAASLFRRTVLHDGQEASTRYIDFASGNDLPELSTLLPLGSQIDPELVTLYRGLQHKSLELYLGWFPKVFSSYQKHFQINIDEKSEKDALTARTYDTVRGFLLSGFRTSMVYVTNATSMQQMLSDFGAGRLPGESQLSDNILSLLRPEDAVNQYHAEIKSLLNHVEPSYRNQLEQQKLDSYLLRDSFYHGLLTRRRRFSGLVNNDCQLVSPSISFANRIIAQYILTLHPALLLADIQHYVDHLSEEQRLEIGKIIFSTRDRFYLPSMSSSSSSISHYFSIDFGIERDLGRHRAWERLSPIHETYVGLSEIASTGFTQIAYLNEISEFSTIKEGMKSDMLDYYQLRTNFLTRLASNIGQPSSDAVAMYLLPLAHQVDMIMNGDVRYQVHLQDIRIREGAHIDARLMTAKSNSFVANIDPLFASLAYPRDRVVVDSRDQFLSRQ
jgi:hypothetical protein